MSDKGRELLAILFQQAVSRAGNCFITEQESQEEADCAFELIRSHGWLHEDDVVEGKIIADVKHYHTPTEHDIDTCDVCGGNFRNTRKHFIHGEDHKRPALVKDLIG